MAPRRAVSEPRPSIASSEERRGRAARCGPKAKSTDGERRSWPRPPRSARSHLARPVASRGSHATGPEAGSRAERRTQLPQDLLAAIQAHGEEQPRELVLGRCSTRATRSSLCRSSGRRRGLRCARGRRRLGRARTTNEVDEVPAEHEAVLLAELHDVVRAEVRMLPNEVAAVDLGRCGFLLSKVGRFHFHQCLWGARGDRGRSVGRSRSRWTCGCFVRTDDESSRHGSNEHHPKWVIQQAPVPRVATSEVALRNVGIDLVIALVGRRRGPPAPLRAQAARATSPRAAAPSAGTMRSDPSPGPTISPMPRRPSSSRAAIRPDIEAPATPCERMLEPAK